MLEINALVPDFSLMGSDNNEHKLSEYRGKNIVLYFYPRDNTPGCSTEACDFRDNNNNFNDNNTVVIGISRDSLKSHNKFIEKFNLPFILLSDENEEVCNLFIKSNEIICSNNCFFAISEANIALLSSGYFIIIEFKSLSVISIPDIVAKTLFSI